MWLLIITLVLDDGSERFRFASEHVAFRTQKECIVARDWWIAHGEALPEGYAPPWRQLIGPDCEPASPAIS